jgi:carbonic anhydrase
VTDPYKATAADVAVLRGHPAMPADLVISGLVYDVATGRVSSPRVDP